MRPFRYLPGVAVCVAGGVLAASSLVFGQETYPAPPPPASQQQEPGGNGNGWPPPPSYGAPAANPPANQPNAPAPPPIPAQLTLAAGTYLPVRIDRSLSSDKSHPGDMFTATLEAPVVANGVVVAQPGQMLGGRVAIAEKHNSDQPGRLGIELTSLPIADGQQLPIESQLVSRRGGTTPGGEQVGTVATTAGIGAIIGAAAGWGTGAAIGAASGGLAGLIGVMVTRHHASVIYAEQELTFRLRAPVTISTVNAPQAFHYIEPGEYNQPTLESRPGPYANTAPAPPPPPMYYPYPYYGWGYPYWGPGFAAYWGPGFFWGRGYYRGYHGAFVHGRGFAYGHIGR